MRCFFSFLKGMLLGTRSFLLTNGCLLFGIGGGFLIEHAGGLIAFFVLLGKRSRVLGSHTILLSYLLFIKQKNLPSKDERFLISARQRSTLAGGSPQLPLTQKSLTAVFGMGTGVTSSLLPPDYLTSKHLRACCLVERNDSFKTKSCHTLSLHHIG